MVENLKGLSHELDWAFDGPPHYRTITIFLPVNAIITIGEALCIDKKRIGLLLVLY
jgi:hypothetical protein